MKHFQNSMKMKKNIKCVCIFYHRPGFQPLKHDAWSFSFASYSGIMTFLTVDVANNICRAANLEKNKPINLSASISAMLGV